MMRLLVAEKQKHRYDSFVRVSDGKRIDAVLKRDAAVCPAMGRMTKKIRAKGFFRKLECNVLKDHDSRVNKRVKSSAERASNACRAHAERAPNTRRMAPDCAALRGRARKSKSLAPTASRRPALLASLGAIVAVARRQPDALAPCGWPV